MQTELRLFWGKASAINNKKLTFEPSTADYSQIANSLCKDS